MYIHGHLIALILDLVSGESPLILGLHATQYANIINTEGRKRVELKRPTDVRTLALFTYVGSEDIQGHTKRIHLEIIPHANASATTLMANIRQLGTRKPLALSKKLHRFTHSPTDELKGIRRTAGILNPDISRAIDTVHGECEVCSINGRPASMQKLSLTYVNGALNLEM